MEASLVALDFESVHHINETQQHKMDFALESFTKFKVKLNTQTKLTYKKEHHALKKNPKPLNVLMLCDLFEVILVSSIVGLQTWEFAYFEVTRHLPRTLNQMASHHPIHRH